MRADIKRGTLGHRLSACVALVAMTANLLGPIAAAQAQASARRTTPRTLTPIKHLIVVIGENRSFDNVFATYVPPDRTVGVESGVARDRQKLARRAEFGKGVATTGDRPQGTYQLAPSKTGAFSPLPQPSTALNALPISPCALSKC